MICGHCFKQIELWEDAPEVRDEKGAYYVHPACVHGKHVFRTLPPIQEVPDVTSNHGGDATVTH